jgi:hypothetical protein
MLKPLLSPFFRYADAASSVRFLSSFFFRLAALFRPDSPIFRCHFQLRLARYRDARRQSAQRKAALPARPVTVCAPRHAFAAIQTR